MHKRIGAELWCVTRRDLLHLRHEVAEAIRAGEIRPAERDQFEPSDFTTGPSLYTVNEQFIKPITAAAGNMSWALMRNPKGLTCDLFITHAWQEGIFELLDKVISSWPKDVKHAWCCILANPQNLDISDLIRTPSSSPFAQALREAKYMLVVPNRCESIYTRLWCSYEANLAYQWEKVVVTASRPRMPEFLKVLPRVLGCLASGLVLGKLWQPMSAMNIAGIIGIANYPLPLLVTLCNNRIRHFCNLIGAFLSGYYIGVLWHLWDDGKDDFQMEEEAWSQFRIQVIITSWAFCLFYTFSEYDRISAQVSMLEAENLKYKGSIIDAACTDPNDANMIRAEIGDQIHHVDEALQTLIRAGMSSPELRRAQEAGVDIRRFSDVSYAFLFFVTTKIANVTMLLSKGGRRMWGIQLVYCLAISVCGLVIRKSRVDGRAFIANCTTKFELALDLPAYTVGCTLWKYGTISVETMLDIQLPVSMVCMSCVAILGVMRIDRVAQLPFCGRFIAQVLIAKDWQSCRARRARLPKANSVEQPTPIGRESRPDGVVPGSSDML